MIPRDINGYEQTAERFAATVVLNHGILAPDWRRRYQHCAITEAERLEIMDQIDRQGDRVREFLGLVK